jgi:methyl-accepting chemotaxis protein
MKITTEIKTYINTLTHSWSKVLILLAGVLVPTFFILDYLVAPSHLLKTFFGLRILYTVTAIFQYFILRFTKPGNLSFIHGYITSFFLTVSISLMTFYFGGFDSTYYVGLVLVIVAVNLVTPWEYYHSLFNGILTILVYFSINQFWGPSYDIKNLVNNLFFLAGILVIVIAIKFLNFKLTIKEFEVHSKLKQMKVEENRLFTEAASQVSQKDLSVKITANREDLQQNTLIETFNEMMSDLRTDLVAISKAIQNVAISTRNIKKNTDILVKGSIQQLEYTQVSVDSMNSIIVGIENNSHQIDSTSQITLEAMELTDRSNIISQSQNAVKNIQDILHTASSKFNELEASSKKITEIVKSIAAITKRTSLLSLNASIESARAGEYGKGFSVVADEIRMLSEQSGQATKETSIILETVVKDIRAVVLSFSQISQGTESIQSLIVTTTDMIKETHSIFEKINITIQDFVDTKKEEMRSAQDIRQNIEIIAQISNNFSESIKEIGSSTAELDRLVEELHKDISNFKFE